MTLFFGYSDDFRCISHPKTKSALFEDISRFLKERKYHSYYNRSHTEDGITTYDVGSWCQFFFSVDPDLDIPEEWNNKSVRHLTKDELRKYIS